MFSVFKFIIQDGRFSVVHNQAKLPWSMVRFENMMMSKSVNPAIECMFAIF